jgi:hypothetical protein
MTVLIGEVVLVLATLLVHVVVWRLRLPQQPIQTLVLLFAGASTVPWVAYYAWPPGVFSNIAAVQVTAGTFLIGLCYAVLYSAIEADSPSLMMIGFIETAAGAGRTPEELGGLIQEEAVLLPRLGELAAAGFVEEIAGQLRPTGRGRLFGAIFHTAAAVLNIPKGG